MSGWDKKDEWSLEELQPNLATLVCTCMLQDNRRAAFVEYNQGHLTVLCAKGEDHPDEASAYGMVCLSHCIDANPDLLNARMVGGFSRAVLNADHQWVTSLLVPDSIGEQP